MRIRRLSELYTRHLQHSLPNYCCSLWPTLDTVYIVNANSEAFGMVRQASSTFVTELLLFSMTNAGYCVHSQCEFRGVRNGTPGIFNIRYRTLLTAVLYDQRWIRKTVSSVNAFFLLSHSARCLLDICMYLHETQTQVWQSFGRSFVYPLN